SDPGHESPESRTDQLAGASACPTETETLPHPCGTDASVFQSGDQGMSADLVEPLLFVADDESVAPAATQEAEPALAIALDEPAVPDAPQAAEPMPAVAVDEPTAPTSGPDTLAAAAGPVAPAAPEETIPVLAFDEPAAPEVIAAIAATRPEEAVP